MSGLIVSPIAGLLAFPGSFTELSVVPADCLGVLRLLLSVSRGRTAGAVASGAAAATSRVGLREGGDKVGESSHFCFQLLHLRVVGESSND